MLKSIADAPHQLLVLIVLFGTGDIAFIFIAEGRVASSFWCLGCDLHPDQYKVEGHNSGNEWTRERLENYAERWKNGEFNRNEAAALSVMQWYLQWDDGAKKAVEELKVLARHASAAVRRVGALRLRPASFPARPTVRKEQAFFNRAAGGIDDLGRKIDIRSTRCVDVDAHPCYPMIRPADGGRQQL